MKKQIILFLAVGCLLLASSHASSGILGDIDNDGNIGLTEAINALQVAAGVRSVEAASYVIVWKGAWSAGQDYQIYDAVQRGGSSFLCREAHRSDDSNPPPSARWDLMALKGADGVNGVTPDLTPLLARIGLLENYTIPFAFVSNARANTVTPINLLRQTANPGIPVGTYPSGIQRQPGGVQVWVANTNSHTLSVVDAVTNTVVKTIPRELGPSFERIQSPQSVAFNALGSRVYVGGQDYMGMFDTGSMTPIISKRVQGIVSSLCLTETGDMHGIMNGSLFHVPSNSPFWDPGNRDPRFVPTASGTPAEAILAKTKAAGGTVLYLARGGLLTLYDDDGLRNELTVRYAVKINTSHAKGIAVNQATETAYVLAEEGIISVVNAGAMAGSLTRNIDIRILVNDMPSRAVKALYLHSASGRDLLYVVLGDELSSVAVIDPAAGTLAALIRVGSEPIGIGGP